MSDKIRASRDFNSIPLVITIPGDRAADFSHAMEMAAIYLKEALEAESDPKKRKIGVESALRTIMEVKESLGQIE